jgi:hypothetical protein
VRKEIEQNMMWKRLVSPIEKDERDASWRAIDLISVDRS